MPVDMMEALLRFREAERIRNLTGPMAAHYQADAELRRAEAESKGIANQKSQSELEQYLRNAPIGESIMRGNVLGADVGAANVMNDPVLGQRMREILTNPDAPGPTRDFGGDYFETPQPNTDPWYQQTLRGIMERERFAPAPVAQAITQGAPALRSAEERTAETERGALDRELIQSSDRQLAQDAETARNEARIAAQLKAEGMRGSRENQAATGAEMRDIGKMGRISSEQLSALSDAGYKVMAEDLSKFGYVGAPGRLGAYQSAIQALGGGIQRHQQSMNSAIEQANQLNIDPQVAIAAYRDVLIKAKATYDELVKRHNREMAVLEDKKRLRQNTIPTQGFGDMPYVGP